jgi:hypothetical protein
VRNKRSIGFAAGIALVAMLAAPTWAGTLTSFSAVGSGTVTSPRASGCQFSGLCTVTSEGQITGDKIGSASFVTTLNINWAQAVQNGSGGYCAPASGTSTVTVANGSVLALGEVGTVCEVGETGEPVPHTFNGTYAVCSKTLADANESPCSSSFVSTGRFANSTGTGNVVGGDDGNSSVIASVNGALSF